jgi:hypothetical protein
MKYRYSPDENHFIILLAAFAVLFVLTAWDDREKINSLERRLEVYESQEPKILDCSEDSAIRQELRMCQEDFQWCENELSTLETEIDQIVEDIANEMSEEYAKVPYDEPPC